MIFLYPLLPKCSAVLQPQVPAPTIKIVDECDKDADMMIWASRINYMCLDKKSAAIFASQKRGFSWPAKMLCSLRILSNMTPSHVQLSPYLHFTRSQGVRKVKATGLVWTRMGHAWWSAVVPTSCTPLLDKLPSGSPSRTSLGQITHLTLTTWDLTLHNTFQEEPFSTVLLPSNSGVIRDSPCETMPRRAAEGNRKRTRTGCQRCRLRKIKCDESKPKCGQCLTKGFACHSVSTLKWEDDYLTRGLAFGRRGVWSKGPPTPEHRYFRSTDKEDINWCIFPSIRPYSFVNITVKAPGGGITTLRDTCMSVANGSLVHDNGLIEYEGSSVTSNNITSRLPISRVRNIKHISAVGTIVSQPSLLPGLSTCQSNLLAYYLERLCPLTVASPMAPSPFASLIFPFSITKSSAVMNSLMALSACHIAKRNPSFRTTALRLGDGALGYLKGRLEMGDTRQIALDPEILVLMMVLCLIEIINECDKRWLVHLKGARDLILIRRQALISMDAVNHHSSSELVGFSERFFAYQDVIGRTACGEEPIFSGDFWTAHPTGNITDTWLGCSPELVSILCEITELSRQRAKFHGIASSVGFELQSASLEHRLDNLVQNVSNPEDDILQATAELKRLSASLYLDCALRDAHPESSRVNVATSQILRLVSALLERNIIASLAWPIFVAAVELDPLEDLVWTTEQTVGVPQHGRPFVLYALEQMAEVSVSNISQTRSVIEKVWQSRDMDVCSEEPQGRNDWERYVAPLCHGLSLG